MKNIIKIITITAILIFASCANKKNEKKITLRILHHEGGAGGILLKRMIRRFEKANPDIKIKAIHGGHWSRYGSKMLTMMVSKSDFDLFETTGKGIYNLIVKGYVADITPWIGKYPELAPKNFLKQSMYRWMYDENGQPGKGSLYGFPKDYSFSTMLLYNMDIFKKFGVAIPKENLSEKKIALLAKKLTKIDLQSGIIEQLGWMPPFPETLIVQNGTHLVSKDLKKSTYNQSKAVTAVKYYYELLYKYKCSVDKTTFDQNGGNEDMIGSGKLAIFSTGLYKYPNIKIYNKDNWGTLPPMFFTGQAPRHEMGVATGWAVPAHSKKIKYIVRWLAFVNGKEGNIMTAQDAYNMPCRKEIIFSKYFKGQKGEKGTIIGGFLKQLKYDNFYSRFSPIFSLLDAGAIIKEELDKLSIYKRIPTDNEIVIALKKIDKRRNELVAEK